MNGDNGTSTQAPQMRALLFTDLCDSLILVERIGDAAAAELFQEHDRLVLVLQQQWNGHQIDRSDGLFLLFERTIDALGFALDYQQQLHALGKTLRVPLRVRAGLHVGEVILWNNSTEAVAHGAKPIEVEGLAKPMAARLMQLARPGQILLSALAESLARRSSSDMGERANALTWKSHGRWRFKGMADSQQIWQVAGDDTSPTRRPSSNKKARLDRPLWLHPGALLAEVAFFGILGIVLWTLFRPEPAIAFAERDWVVVGDMRNLTGNTVLDDSLQQAFRISLEQSRYVNVLSDMKARSVIEMMRRDAASPLDAPLASEVAIRVGARLVVLPSVAEVGGRTRINVQVLEPNSQRTVAVVAAEGKGISSLLASIDSVTTQLRDQLGEQESSVKEASAPLPLVTTSSMDALRAYALGQRRYAEGDYVGALSMYEQAVALDEKFALAWMGLVRARVANVDNDAAFAALERVKALSSRLPTREALYVQAWSTTLTDQGNAAQGWMRLAGLYPDYFPAQHNAAMWLYVDNRFKEALPFAVRAADGRFELSNVAYDQLGRIALANGDFSAARRALETAVSGGRPTSHRYLATVSASQRNYAAADAELAKAGDNRYAGIEGTSIAADQGHWTRAVLAANTGVNAMARETGFARQVYLLPLATAHWASGNEQAARNSIQQAVDSSLQRIADASNPDISDDAMVALGASILALRLNDTKTAERVLHAVRARRGDTRGPLLDEMEAVVQAERTRLGGDAAGALRGLQPFLQGSARFQTRVAAMRAYIALGRDGDALEQADFLRNQRGMAYAELDCGYCLQTMNVVDSNAAASVARELRSGGRAMPAATAALVRGP
jgi:putative peptide modification system cyclase